MFGLFLGLRLNTQIRAQKRSDWGYCLWLIPRAFLAIVILVIPSEIYERVDWGEHQLMARLIVKELSLTFLFNLYLYGFSDWVD